MTRRITTVEEVVELVKERGTLSASQVASILGISFTTAFRKLEGAWTSQDLMKEEYDEEGRRLAQPN